MVSSYGHAVILGGKPMDHQERESIRPVRRNSTGIKDHDMDYILKEGLRSRIREHIFWMST